MERQDLKGARIHVQGIVQGVGFRPFVYGLAQRLSLNGWVRNTSAGVDIALDGPQPALDAFVHALRSEAPALARIDSVEVTGRAPDGFTGFEIIESQAVAGAFQPISPDVCICPDCLRELFDPADRRYRYPFINCTNCGPRFTIIQDLPYDRPNTTMAGFPLCPQCAGEYHDPLDRRFHAQPVACPQCGPQVWLEMPAAGIADPGSAELLSPMAATEVARGEDAIQAARRMLRSGRILAIKGLGGFHLACDATNPEAVAELRCRKLRVDKPFALMAPDIAAVEAVGWLSPLEKALLERRERPIVILRRREDSPVADAVAPGQNTLGVMLPYTPLHYLLFAADRPIAIQQSDGQQPGEPVQFDMPVLVMTSGNLSEEPICTGNQEARQRLASLADAFLMHDRDIHIRCDDSVVRVFPNTLAELTAAANGTGKRSTLYPLRRSRGYAPESLALPFETAPLLAAGAELKNTFCLARERYAFLSHHIGDLENYETMQAFESGVRHYERLFRVRPEAIAYDLHPDYLATRYAQERACEEDLPAIGVQHHHAHIAACMADNGLSGETPVIGVAFDGTGFGEDEAVWGGEFLIADYKGYERPVHLAYTPLPGGDKAVREPWRMVLSWLHTAGIDWDADLPPVRYAREQAHPLETLRRQLETGLNAPQTSSMGRLFDAVAALAGVRPAVNYEAQAAIELEALADGREPGYYPFDLRLGLLDPAPALRALIEDLRRGVGLPVIAARFHAGVARVTLDVCLELRQKYKINDVALSGGVWQNGFLLALAAGLLQQEKFAVYLHRQVPANDGGLTLGQAAIAAARLKEK
jgi:hydrogenase maturation protein HypF